MTMRGGNGAEDKDAYAVASDLLNGLMVTGDEQRLLARSYISLKQETLWISGEITEAVSFVTAYRDHLVEIGADYLDLDQWLRENCNE